MAQILDPVPRLAWILTDAYVNMSASINCGSGPDILKDKF